MFILPLQIVGCFLEHNGKFLIIRRAVDDDEFGNTWALPAGKIDAGETMTQAMVREVYEETGYVITEAQLEFFGAWEYVHKAPFTYNSFRARIQEPFVPTLNAREHCEYRWVTGDECFALPDLIQDFDSVLKNSGYVLIS